ncbi:MAG: hypothetical protein HY962_17625 [Ignavibacteriae bacterium]|nr:hypothetical protein [Ignavibacteriota bacterium]
MLAQFHELASDHTSGATEIIHRLLAVCESCVIGQAYDVLREGLALLEQSQSNMPSFHATLHILRKEFLPLLRADGDNAVALGFLTSLKQILDESAEEISRSFLSLFRTPVRVLTISRSGTVLLALRRLSELGRLEHLAVLEARPMLEGHKTLREFNGIARASLYVDAAMGEAVTQSNCAVVGADCVSADGFLLNKTGTFPLALCCRTYEVPLYVLCDSLKFSPQLREHIPVEESPDSDIVTKQKKDTFTVVNKYFEWTPIDLVTAFITERGIFTPEKISGIAGE